jgi:hypothetical protein
MTTTERNTLTTSLKAEINTMFAANKLTGSDKQIAWADTIRREYIGSRVDECSDAHDMYVIKLYAEWLSSTHTESKYWTDSRDKLALVKRQTMAEFGKTLDRAVLLDKSIVYTVPEQVEDTEPAAEPTTESTTEPDPDMVMVTINVRDARVARNALDTQLKQMTEQLREAQYQASRQVTDPDNPFALMSIESAKRDVELLTRQADALSAVIDRINAAIVRSI